MQINIGRRSAVILGAFILVAAGVISLSINKSDSQDMNAMSGHSGHMSTSTNSNYTGADIMFLQMMIPHHQQAIDISNLAMKVSKDSELLALAQKIAADQAAEITQMKAWLKDAGASEDPGHAMDGMGGMLTDADLAKLKAATGKDFDILWLTGMTGHHDGAVHMTMMIEDANNADIKAFGEKVVADQSAQIEQMKKMLTRINNRG
jgi:uncharacterized protein (DUF305 family)